MKLIILAAGKGTRLLPLTQNTPKILLDMGNGKTLLEEQLERVEKSGVFDEVVLVVGYLSDQIEAKIQAYRDRPFKISLLFNPFYASSNNLMSLWLAKWVMNTDFVVTNGDNVFDGSVFKELAEKNKQGIFLTVSKKVKYDEDDMKVIMDGDFVSYVHKKIANEKADFESVGLSLVASEASRKAFIETLELLAKDAISLEKFWLEVYNELHKSGVPVMPFQIDGESKWREVDFHWDIEKVRNLLGLSDF